MKFIIGKKIAMTQVFREDGIVVPVTKVLAGPCVVTQIKTKEKDNNNSLQIGFGTQKIFRLNKSEKGHLDSILVDNNKNQTVRNLHEFKNDNSLNKGDVFGVEIFTVGEKVKVTGTSKGKGFQGVVKRHGFHGNSATHGHKDQERMPGSIGATDPQRVFKGKRMGGHMGDEQVSVKNLEIVKIDLESNELYIKGAVPGARNSLLYIFAQDGKIDSRGKTEGKTEEKIISSIEENNPEEKQDK